MSRSITVNTGEKIMVKNTDGEVMGYFYFNPADPDLMRRCDGAQKKIEEIYQGIKENPSAEEILKANEGLKEQMKYILGNSAADTLFRYNSPLAIMPDGELYGVYVFETVYEFIKTEMSERMEKAERQADKYTAKYQV